VMQRLAPIRETLDLAVGETDERVIEEAKELRQLAGNYLTNERFLIGHTRRKALLQARKKIELARPYQTSKWAERELEKIDAAIPTGGFDAKQKKRRAGIHRRKAEADAVLVEINQRYDKDWVKLEALDKKAEALRRENIGLLSRMDASKQALGIHLTTAEIRGEIAGRIKQTQPDTMHRQTSTPTKKTATFEPRQSQSRVRIRATIPGLEAALAQMDVRSTVSDPGPQNSPAETALSSQQAADTVSAPEQLSENSKNGSHTQTSAAKKKSPFNLTRRPQITLK
jgi:hypothetical protein